MRPAAPLDADIVAVFPFAISSASSGLSDLRDVIQDLVVAKFPGGDGGPRALNINSLRERDDGLTREVMVSRAAQVGAGQVLYGEIAGTPDELSIDAVLVAVPTGAVQAHARVQADADSLPYLVDRLAARLLALQAARDSGEIDALIGASPPALRAYLAGIRANRLGKMGVNSEATRHFERALFFDSTFALAGLRLAELAVVFGMSGLDERWKLDAVWKQRGHMAPADHSLLIAYLGPRYPRPSSLAELIAAAERASVTAPQRAEGWRILGIYLDRFGSTIGYTGWERRAAAALDRALVLDPSDATTREFRLRVAVETGDSAVVRRYAASLLRDPVGPRTDFYRWVAATVVGDSVTLTDLRRRLAEVPRLSSRYIMSLSLLLRSGLEDGDSAAAALERGGRGMSDLKQIVEAGVPFALNRGRPAKASRLLAAAEDGFRMRKDVGVLEFQVHAGLFWDGDSSDAAAAARSLQRYLDGAPMRQGHVRHRESALCALAHWRLALGDLEGAEDLLQRLRAQSAAYELESTPTCIAAVDAQLAAARRRADATIALARLDSLLNAGSDVQHLVPFVAILTAANLHEARGDLATALALVRRRSSWTEHLLSTLLREEGRLAALTGDTAGAARAYGDFLAIRSDPEPGLRPDVERVRGELRRLRVR